MSTMLIVFSLLIRQTTVVRRGSGGAYAEENMSGRAHSVICEMSLLISTFVHVVSPVIDPSLYWGPYLRLYGSPAAGGPRQTSIFDYGRLHTICSCTQMLVPSLFDQIALGCCSSRVYNDIATIVVKGNGSFLVIRDLSAVFDRIAHDNLFYILER